LAGRQPAIFPSRFPAADPSRGTPVAVAVNAVFVSLTPFPAAVVITIAMAAAIAAAGVLVVLAKMFVWTILVPVSAVVGLQSRGKQSESRNKYQYCQQPCLHDPIPAFQRACLA
jgi:hypothetical protein